MNCKNCNYILQVEDTFCSCCGAKVIRGRMSIRLMVDQLMTEVFGWDNKYFRTLRDLIVRPRVMLQSYLDGTRKRYMNPLGFMIIGLTVSLFIFNVFHDQYLEVSVASQKAQIEWMAKNIGGPYAEIAFQKEQLDNARHGQEQFLKYFNILTFILLPIYALFSWVTFGKPLNYAEHLTVNTYLQGFSFITTPIFFLLAVWVSPYIFMLSLLFTMGIYSYSYGQLYKLGLGQIILKLIIFIALAIGVFFVFGIIAFLIGLAFAIVTR